MILIHPRFYLVVVARMEVLRVIVEEVDLEVEVGVGLLQGILVVVVVHQLMILGQDLQLLKDVRDIVRLQVLLDQDRFQGLDLGLDLRSTIEDVVHQVTIREIDRNLHHLVGEDVLQVKTRDHHHLRDVDLSVVVLGEGSENRERASWLKQTDTAASLW